ncbi:MAG: 16S rRNA (cytosine(1407)-C(5))-methyltransferase RsmF [Parashewanella sp.]
MAIISSEFIDHISGQLPAHLSLESFLDFCNKPLRLSIRVNTLKISCADFLALIQQKNWKLTPIPWCDSGFWIELPDDIQLGNSVEHQQGLFYIQEASSMLPPLALFSDLVNCKTVLDMAAAPGSKTTQIAALMENKGLLIANEYSSSRIKMLHANLVRTGVTNCALTHFDAEVFGEYLFESFDAILLDAPCGGEGTVRKDVDALKSWQLSDVLSIAEKQKQLIKSAFEALKVGGTLVYSTCTLSKEENQQVCYDLKTSFPDAVEFVSLNNLFEGSQESCTEEGFLHVWPQTYDSEGFFVAKIKKIAKIPQSKSTPKKQKNFPFTSVSSKQQAEIQLWLNNAFNITIPSNLKLMCRDNQFWLFPIGFDEFIGKMRFQRIGLKLAEQKGKHLKLSHEAATALANQQSNKIDITQAQAAEYLKGRDIPLTDAVTTKGEMLVFHNQTALGLTKHLGSRLKNNLPRDLVRDNTLTL